MLHLGLRPTALTSFIFQLDLMPLPRWRVEVSQKFLVNAGFLALLTLIVVTITSLYIINERNFHWWVDWYYPTINIATAFRESPTEAIHLVQETLVEERNRLYSLPLVPFILVFGTSRLVYEISLALVYLLPLTLAMGAIATQLIRVHPQTVFWSTALLTLLIPVNWVPTFMGIPDTGGALFIALAVWVYLQDVRLKRWWRIPLIGFLIGVSILLRRHFVYGGLAFLGGLTLQALIFFFSEVRRKPQIALRNLLLFGVRISLIAATSFIAIATVAWEFTYQAMTTDYGTFYASWTLPFSDVIPLYAYFFGWATLLMVAIGFSASIATGSVSLPALRFIGLAGILSLIIWLVELRYGNIFYALHVTPLVIIGLVAFLWTTWSRLTGKIRTLMLSVAGCYLISNLVIGLTPIGQFDSFFRPLFALSNPPLVRTDYDEVGRLVNYLRQLAPNQEPIFVVGNQRLQLDSSLVRVAELILYGRERMILNVLRSPKVDSRDDYPLESLLQAQYVVVPNPLPDYPGIPTKVPAVGEWLPNKEIDVVKVAFDAFTQNWEFARDFKLLPVQFKFSGNAVISIYQRTRPTSVERAVRTFYAMQQQIGERPGGQVDWTILSQQFNNASITKYTDNTYQLVSDRVTEAKDSSTQGIPAKGSPTLPLAKQLRKKQELALLPTADGNQALGTTFLYLGTLPAKAEVTGTFTFSGDRCVSSSLRLAIVNKEGQILSTTKTEYSPKDSSSLRLSIDTQNSGYLLLNVLGYNKNNLVDACHIQIDSLAVSARKNDKQ